MSNELALLNAIEKMAHAFAKSRIYGIASVDDWMSLMFTAHSEGRHPASVGRDYHIINGRPALRADTILARFQQAGGTVKWVEISDSKVTGIFSHPQGGEIEVTWDTARAQQAELKSPMWKKFPRQMLRARTASEAVRAIYPVVLGGFYEESEVVEMPPIESAKKINDNSNVIDDDALHEKIHESITTCLTKDELAKNYNEIKNAYDLNAEQLKVLNRATNHIKSQILEAVNAPND